MFSLRDTKKFKRLPSASQFVPPSRRRLPYLITLVEDEEVKMGRIWRLGRTPAEALNMFGNHLFFTNNYYSWYMRCCWPGLKDYLSGLAQMMAGLGLSFPIITKDS